MDQLLSKDNLNEAILNAILDFPLVSVTIDTHKLDIWPSTLGMSMMVSRILSEIDVNEIIMANNPAFEVLRLLHRKRDKVCRIIAIHTFRKRLDLENSHRISRRAEYLSSNLEDTHLAQLFLSILSEPKAETLISLSPLAEERDKQVKIAKLRHKKNNSISFGRLTIYASLITTAMTSLNMSFEEVVWGVSLINLKMMLADKANSIYLSEEELAALGDTSSKEIFGMSANDFAALKSMNWD